MNTTEKKNDQWVVYGAFKPPCETQNKYPASDSIQQPCNSHAAKRITIPSETTNQNSQNIQMFTSTDMSNIYSL